MLAAMSPPFTQLFRERAPDAGRALRNLGVHEADLPETLRETFLVVHRRLPSFRGTSSLRTWIYEICLRVAAAYRRRSQHRRGPPREDTDAAVSHRNPHEEALRREALARLDAALARLDDDRRAVFVLYEIEELTLAEIAGATGTQVPTVYSRLQSARSVIHAAFGEGSAGAKRGEAG